MASYQPPIETLPIFDNSVFAAVSSNTVLTIAQANLLYLRKTYPDTATALETFQAGILSSSINPLTVSSALDIGTTQTSSNISIGNDTTTGTIVINTASTLNTNSAPAIAIGTSGSVKTIKIGSSAVTQSIHLAQLDVTTNSLNNFVGTTGDMNIGNFQTSGALYLGCRSGGSTRTGGTINIGTDSTTTGQIKIGNSTATCPIVIDTASILNTDAAPAIAIGTASSIKWIKIGNALGGQNNTVALGNIKMRTSPTGVEINGTSNPNTTPIFLGNQQSTSALNLGCGFGPDANVIRAVGGDINIANGVSNACNINIMNGNTTAGNVNIANGTGVTQTTAVNIASGTTTGIVTIGNSTGVHTLSSPCVKLQGDFNYLALNTQSPSIPRSIVAVSSGANTGLYFKSSTTASAGSYDSYILASGGTSGDTSGTLTSNANTFSFISGSTSLGSFNTNGLNMNKPITFSTGSTPIDTTQLGGIISSTNIINTTFTLVSGFGTIGTVIIANAGTYIFSFLITGTYTSISALSFSLSGTNIATGLNYGVSINTTASGTYTSTGSIPVICTASTYTLGVYHVGSGGACQSAYSYIKAIRIG